ncbi:hypothetical protein ASG01_14160 [Chryseobacterium sp. Leaf180]|uniref:SRPBCC family protein n=1 Tax=Chryseobacterium sp. Leaf180 TaxID=1736289 RepID=UPI0006F9CAA8|nr:SRPBCC family protein [Chryseobacterium sp. Leaf180]KQR91508.1 hypothetical protein ASG01_14160 [Chryseobacterium sp. Leaf180]
MNRITVKTEIDAPVKKVWDYFTNPAHITKWNFAHESWHCPHAENDIKAGGNFNFRMEAKDGSFGFDFKGKYDSVNPPHTITYTLEDGRNVEIVFQEMDGKTEVTQIFEPEKTNSEEMQESGWQAILDQFKNYTENN